MSKKSSNKKVFSFKKYLVIFLVILSILFSGLIYFINVLPLEYFWVFIVTLGIIDVIVALLLLSNGHVRNLVGGFFSFILIIGMIFGINYSLNTMDFFKQFGFNEYKIENYNILVLNTSNYKNIKDLNNQVIGYLDKDKYEGLNKAIDKLSKKISFKSNISSDVSDLFTKLEEKIVNAIILEDAQISILKEEVSNFDEIIKSIDVIEVEIKNKDIGKSVDVVNNSFNIYISGIDTYGSINKVSRSDVNIIMSVNPTTKEILLTNIPRDYYVKVNFTSLVDIVDALGGVTVNSKYSFVSQDGYSYKKGENVLDGKKALSFARERKSFKEGDRVRGENQQLVLTALINKAMSPKIITNYVDILKALKGKFVTNISDDEITKLIKMQLEDGSSWSINSISVNGSDAMDYVYSYKKTKLYVMKPDEETVLNAKNNMKKVLENK